MKSEIRTENAKLVLALNNVFNWFGPYPRCIWELSHATAVSMQVMWNCPCFLCLFGLNQHLQLLPTHFLCIIPDGFGRDLAPPLGA